MSKKGSQTSAYFFLPLRRVGKNSVISRDFARLQVTSPGPQSKDQKSKLSGFGAKYGAKYIREALQVDSTNHSHTSYATHYDDKLLNDDGR